VPPDRALVAEQVNPSKENQMKVVTIGDVVAEDANADGRSTRTGSYAGKRLFTQDEPDGLNLVFLRNEFHDESAPFVTPRHRHTFAQVKFVEKGSSNYAPERDIHQGELAYFPRMAYYGPQSKANCTSIGLQFGFNGEHQKGPVWEGYRAEALEHLKARGTIADGSYADIDPATGERRVRDGVEAVYEEQYLMHTGKQLVARDGGYEAPILMRPSSFDWFPVSPGVDVRYLGRFYDQPGPNGDIRISMVRLSEGGECRLSSERAQVAWTTGEHLVVDGNPSPEAACVFSPRHDEGVIAGEGGLEVYVLELPRLD
jgi:hypothetical protein